MEKAAFNKNNTLFTRKLDLNLRTKLVECYIWNIHWYGVETWSLGRKIGMVWKVLNVVLEKDGDQLDRWSEKFTIFTKSHGKEEYPTNNKNHVGQHILPRSCLLKDVAGGKILERIE